MSMADRDGVIWYDGKMVPWRDANTHVLTHSLHYGLAVFEGLRAYKTDKGTAIFRLKEHTERMFNSAHIYMMKIPYDRETLMAAQKEVVRANKLDSCYVRPIAFYGSEKMGVSPKGAKVHVAIAAWPWGAYLGTEGEFVRIELLARQELSYPPFSTMIKFTHEGGKQEGGRVLEDIERIFGAYHPVTFPSFIGKVRGKYLMNALLRIPKEKSQVSENVGWPNDELLGLIRALPPDVEVRVNPDSII